MLDRLVVATQLRYPVVGDLARSARFRWFDQPIVQAARASVVAGVRDEVAYLAANPDAADSAARLDALAAMPEPIVRFLAERLEHGIPEREPMLEVLARRHYLGYELHDLRNLSVGGRPIVTCDYTLDDRPTLLVTTRRADAGAGRLGRPRQPRRRRSTRSSTWPKRGTKPSSTSTCTGRRYRTRRTRRPSTCRRSSAASPSPGVPAAWPLPSAPGATGRSPTSPSVRGRTAFSRTTSSAACIRWSDARLNLWRLRDFRITRLEAPEDVLLYHCVAPDNDSDQRLVALSQVRELAVVRDAEGHVTSLPQAERALMNCLEAIRRARAARGSTGSRLDMNHVFLHIWPVIDAPLDELTTLQRTIAPLTAGAGIEEILAAGHASWPPTAGRTASRSGSPTSPAPASSPRSSARRPSGSRRSTTTRRRSCASRRRGTSYPYELLPMLTGPGGSFSEHDLDDTGALVPVERPARAQQGRARRRRRPHTRPPRHPEGITRVVLLGDPTRALGAVAEAECARVIAALDLAEQLSVPVEWFALSAGARISMDSGTENMDWVAPRAAPDHHVHPGRRRDQRDRRRHQRRCPALLER